MKQIIKELLKDKVGNYSMREMVIGVLLIALIASWIAKQFYSKDVPEFMFYTFGSLIAAGCFGYTFEKKSVPQSADQ
ncbi:MAG: hypothetical protein ACHQD8_01315 [Chitinophagales bacterium]